MSGKMNSILDVNPTGRTPGKRLRNPRFVAALLMMAVLAVAFYNAVVYLETHAQANPLMIMAFPVIGIGTFLLLLPLLFFVSFEDDFRRVNPLNPRDYAFLARKAAKAVAENNWKVSAKDV